MHDQRREGKEEDERGGRSKNWDRDFGGRGILAVPQGSPVMANNAELGRWGWGPSNEWNINIKRKGDRKDVGFLT